MMTKQQQVLSIFAGMGLLLVLVSAIGLMLYGVYFKVNASGPVRVMARVLNLPAAKVGSQSVSYDRFLMTRDAVVMFINSEAGQEVGAYMPPEKELNDNILERLIRQAMIADLAKQKGIMVDDEQVNLVFEDVKSAAASSTTPDVGEYLWKNYGWQEADFKEEVLRPALLEQDLATAMAQESEGNQYALEEALAKKRAEPDVVVYLKFE